MSSLPPPPPSEDLPANSHSNPVNHKRAMASLICGIVGILILPIIFGPVAVVLGVQARGFIRSQPQVFKGDSLALTGIFLGVLDIVFFIILVTSVD